MSLVFSAITQVILFIIVPFIWWAITNRKENFIQWLGLKKPVIEGSVLKLCITTLSVAGIYSIAMIFIMSRFMSDVSSATSQFADQGIKAIPLILVYAVVQTSLSEEILFRGFLCKRLTKRFGFVIGNGIQAGCFGLAHGIPFFAATKNVLVFVLVTLLPAIIGYYQGYINEKKASGSIVPSWMLHALMNVISALAASL